jgi:hypothetical protein
MGICGHIETLTEGKRGSGDTHDHYDHHYAKNHDPHPKAVTSGFVQFNNFQLQEWQLPGEAAAPSTVELGRAAGSSSTGATAGKKLKETLRN